MLRSGKFLNIEIVLVPLYLCKTAKHIYQLPRSTRQKIMDLDQDGCLILHLHFNCILSV